MVVVDRPEQADFLIADDFDAADGNTCKAASPVRTIRVDANYRNPDVAVELSAATHRGLYVPERFAHGYQVLEDNTETTYLVGQFYTPAAESGLRYSDPRLGIAWPLPATGLTAKDDTWPLLEDAEGALRTRMLPSAVAVLT